MEKKESDEYWNEEKTPKISQDLWKNLKLGLEILIYEDVMKMTLILSPADYAFNENQLKTNKQTNKKQLLFYLLSFGFLSFKKSEIPVQPFCKENQSSSCIIVIYQIKGW